MKHEERFYKNKPKLTGNGKFKQGIFHPINKSKYIGDINNIVYRSGLELKWYKFFDLNPSIIQWKCEEYVVGYINPIDHQQHKYFIDVFIRYITKNKEVRECLVEIKPLDQTKPPILKNRKSKSFRYAVKTYIVNEAKWNSAITIAQKNGMDFKILTEDGFVTWKKTY